MAAIINTIIPDMCAIIATEGFVAHDDRIYSTTGFLRVNADVEVFSIAYHFDIKCMGFTLGKPLYTVRLRNDDVQGYREFRSTLRNELKKLKLTIS